MSQWSPTQSLLHGRVVKHFKGEGVNSRRRHLATIYPGDEVYVFETLDDLWARGYTIHNPRPSDYSSAAIDIKKLPEKKVKVAVFPLACIKIIGECQINDLGNDLISNDSSSNMETSSSYENYDEDDEDLNENQNNLDLDGSMSLKKHKRPQIPLTDISSSTHNLAEEIILTLQTVSSSLFAVYSKSNFEFFDKLVAIYNELDDMRISLISGILTKREEKMSKKKISFLMNKFSKLLASGGGLIDRSQHSKSDIDGKESILARDEDTAELFILGNESNIKSPAKIAQSQILSALTPNYPWGQSGVSFVPEKNVKYDGTAPSNILVDVKQVVASSPVIPDGYAGMKAYMFLRNTKRRITEAFAINISPDQDLSLDNLAAAMFTNIPTTSINGGRIYLVAILTETIANNASNKNEIEVHNELPIIRKGICAGVADISRIFSRRKGHLISGQAHRFSIKLFSSYLDSNKQEVKIFQGMSSMMAKSMTMVNNGWGELVDRIISGSNRGVAINPRAERLILSIKELKLEAKNRKILDSISKHEHSALACIPILSYSPLEKDSNRLFLRLIRTSLTGSQFKDRSYISVHVRGSSESQLFSKGANEKPQKLWRFLSTSPEEIVNEMITVKGFPDVPKPDDDFLIFDVYSNKTFVGSTHYLVRKGNTIFDTGIFGKNTKTMDILSTSNISVGSLQFDLEYVGKTYNVEKASQCVLSWRKYFGNDLKANQTEFIENLNNVKKIKSDILVGEFSNICEELISAFEAALNLKLVNLQNAIFEALILTLDIAVARNEEHVSIFNAMLQKRGSKFAKVGEHFLDFMSNIFNNHEIEWTSIGRATCRVSILLLKISSKCFSNTNIFQTHATEFSLSISRFMKNDNDTFISEQLLVMETLELYLEVFKPWFTSSDLVRFAISWINANYLRGLGSLPEENATALINRKKNREHSYIIDKLLFVNRLINGAIISYGTQTDKEIIFSCALDFSLSVITAEKIDLECSRLALSVILSVCERSFGQNKSFNDDSNQLYFTLIKVLPLFANEFTRYKKYCFTNGLLKAKRIFTDLFPSAYPFEEYTMDSIVNDCVFSEVLVEFTIVMTCIVKMYEANSIEFLKFVESGKSNNYFGLEDKFNLTNIFSSSAVSVLVDVSHDISLSEYYPKGIWLSLNALALETSYLLSKLVENYMPNPSKENIPLWNKFITNLFEISTAKPSSIEHLELTPKMASYLLIGDIRAKITPVIYSSWENLGSPLSLEDKARFQLEKFNGFQRDIVSMNNYKFLYNLFLFSMQRAKTCLFVGGKILWSIIAAEVAKDESLFDLERESVSSLYDLFEKKNAYTAEPLEINSLIHNLQKIPNKMDPEDTDVGEVNKFVKTLSLYLTSLSDLKRIPNGDEFDDDRTFHSLNISSFLMNVDKPELFQSFVNEMFEKNLSKNNFVQAALSLELLANTYDWDINAYLPECHTPQLPSQTAFKRKIDLFKIIATKFIMGHKLEQAVDIYTEMLNAYMSINFDLAGISFCHNELGKLYESLQTVDRLESTFFKISFIGLGFPESLRGKEFIYEGMAYEHITSINNRLNRLYPGSKVISNDDEASKLLRQKPLGKFLHIKTVNPNKSGGSNEMSFMAKQYVDNRNLNSFVSTRRLPGSTSILNLWTEETTYTTYMTFPTLMNRSEIKSIKTVKVPPVKNAIKSLLKRNEELSNLEYLIHQNLKDNISLETISASSMFEGLSRILAGTVDSPVNGGAGEFKIFLGESVDFEKGESDEEFSRDCTILKMSFFRLTYLLNNLLKLHGLIVPDSLKLQHASMDELFRKNFSSEIEQGQLDVTTPLKYTQLMSSLTSTHIHSKHRHVNNADDSENTFNYFGSQLTRTSSHNTIGSTDKKPSSTNSRHNPLSYSHSGSLATGRISGIFTSSRDDSSAGMSEYSHADDSLNTKMSSSLKNPSKRMNILNYK